MHSSGAKRTSAYTTPSAARSCGALVGDPLDRVAVLHHADGVGERLEVEHEVVALGAPVEPRRRGRRRRSSAARGSRTRRPARSTVAGRSAAVEVVVQQHLGQRRDASCRRRRDSRGDSPRAVAAACRPGAAASSTSGSRRPRRCSGASRRGGCVGERLTSLQWGSRPWSTTSVPAGTSSGHQLVGRRRQRGACRARSNSVPSSSVSPARLKTLRSAVRWPPGRGPQAAVVERGVLDGEPEPGDGHRVGVEERRVLVAADLAADVRLLEDVHALQGQRVGEADVGGDVGQLGRCSVNRSKTGSRSCIAWPILLMLSSLACASVAVLVERLLLEEAPDAGAGGEELAGADPLLFVGGEDRAVLARVRSRRRSRRPAGRSSSHAARSTKPGTTRKPSRWYCSI